MDLEQIAKDAEFCAAASWWQAHDMGSYTVAGELFVKQEKVISKYAGNEITNPQGVAVSFALALHHYDYYTKQLRLNTKKAKSALNKILEYLTRAYSQLGIEHSKKLAKATLNWWTSFAKAKLATKALEEMAVFESKRKEIPIVFEKYQTFYTKVFEAIFGEHIIKYSQKLDVNEARGLTCLMLAAGCLGHEQKDWAKAHELQTTYYKELFTALSKK